MKVVIFGSREITDLNIVKEAVKEANIEITEIISGGARGVDTLAVKYARENNIPCKMFPADWDTYGKVAGFMRNKEMAEYSDFGIGVWDGESRGTKHMIEMMRNKDTSKNTLYLKILK